MNLTKPLIAVISFIILSCLLVANYCEAHDAFYPHPHIRDLKAVAKKGRILVITLVVSAGLMVLISTAVIRGDKDRDDSSSAKDVDPAKLRMHVIAAASSGRRGLSEGREQASYMAFYEYARELGIQWKNEQMENSFSVTRNIGSDRVTVIIQSDCQEIEVRAICGNMGASAIASADEDSIRSSIFTSRSAEVEEDV